MGLLGLLGLWVLAAAAAIAVGLAAPASAGSRKVEGRAYLLTGDEKLKFKTGDLGRTVDPGFQMVLAFPPDTPGGFLMQEFEVADDEEPDAEPPPTLSGTYVLQKARRRVKLDPGASMSILLDQLRDFIEEEVFGEDVDGDVVVDELLASKFAGKLDRRFRKLRLSGRVKLRASSASRGESWVVVYKLDLAGKKVPLDILE